MNIDPDIQIVLATLVTIFATSSLLAGWAERRLSVPSLIALLIGLGLFGFLHSTRPDGLRPLDIPDAFINVVAMIL